MRIYEHFIGNPYLKRGFLEGRKRACIDGVPAGRDIGGGVNMENRKSTGSSSLAFPGALVLGVALGALLMLGVSEERRYGIKKTAFELKELPFRIFL